MAELKVGTRELKNKLSEYLRRVKAGEIITVTEHGKRIGQIIPIKPTLEEKIQTMVETGQAEWNGLKLPSYTPSVIHKSDKQLSDLVIEDRE
ncbi:MAG: type II toxin-antitoxin system prevent-host-death family antitoxin [Anaerolineaceae bacterium]|nr:type II toxin-antitoxin system prevent-host-death family antitoxin [Anaerolineaceae bacterium]